jgi:hypothetical protein
VCLLCAAASGEEIAPPARPYAVDHDAPLAAEERVVEKAAGYTKFHVTFNGIRKDRVPGFLYVPVDGQAKRPAVLLQYGSGGHKGTFYIVALAQQFLERAGVWPRVTYHREEATVALRRVGGTWDIVYVDIDKDGYPETVDLAYDHLRPGGLMITDNVLWSGRILDGESKDESTRGVLAYDAEAFAAPDLFTTIVPLRDGVAVSLKLPKPEDGRRKSK